MNIKSQLYNIITLKKSGFSIVETIVSMSIITIMFTILVVIISNSFNIGSEVLSLRIRGKYDVTKSNLFNDNTTFQKKRSTLIKCNIEVVNESLLKCNLKSYSLNSKLTKSKIYYILKKDTDE